MRYLFVLRGAPGSGKSTWVKENELDSYTISTDNLRLMYQSPVTTSTGEFAISQNHEKEVWDMVMDLMERRMENGELIVMDATHYKSILINRYKKLADKYRYRIYVVDFSNVPEEELKRRNTQRGFRNVPMEVIEKMCVALKDSSEVKKSFTIVSPDEAIKLINSPLKPYVIPENINKVVIFGDIHGCYDPLKEYFDKNPFNEQTNYIFVGDYLDRGIQNKEVLEFVISIKDKKNCVFLEGNHEKWLRLYSSKHFNMQDYENRPVKYKDPYVTKVLAQLKDRQITLQKQINTNKNIGEELSKLLKESWETNPDNQEVYWHFELVNVPDKQKELQADTLKKQHQLEVLSMYIHTIQHEEFSTCNDIAMCNAWYSEEFNTKLGMDITNILEKNYNVTSNRVGNPIKSLEFIKRTYPQIKDVDTADIRRFCDRLAQMSYFEFNGYKYLVTHGGLPCMPTMKTQTKEMVHGVGRYEDHESIDNMFVQNQTGKSRIKSVHGHRNVMRDPIINNAGETFNLEGQVEFGGCLRILELQKDGLATNIRAHEIKNNTFNNPEPEVDIKGKDNLNILKDMWDSKWVNVKNLEDNIISFNFTRDAFEKGKWNTITCKARGLFVDKTNGNIVARSFDKFHNYNQCDETKAPALKQNFAYPIYGYRKENGFLGIVSKYKGKVRFFTKSSDGGDFVNWFIGALCDNYEIYQHETPTKAMSYSCLYDLIKQLKEKGGYILNGVDVTTMYKCQLDTLKDELVETLMDKIQEGYSYVFECIDPVNDPHIIKYDKSKVVLLEVFKNQLEEETISYENLLTVGQTLNVPVKKSMLKFDNWEQFEEWKDGFRQGSTQWNCKHEGYVLEDANHFRVKFKSSYYSFWKQMRGILNALQGGRTNMKIYKDRNEILVVKLLETYTREQLQEMSIIDIEDKFHEMYEDAYNV